MSNQPPPPENQPTPPPQPAGQGQSGPEQGQPQTVYVERAGSGMAVAALVCGIFGLVIALIPILGIFGIGLGLIAFVVGLIARSKAKKGTASGKGIATSAVVIGVLAVTLGIAGLVIVGDVFDQLDADLADIQSELDG